MLLVLSGIWCGVMSQAQTATGTITGTVTDPADALVMQAQVTVRDRATGLTYTAETLKDGTYTVPLLPVGTYEIRVTAPGFEAFHQNLSPLDVNQRLRVNVALVLGAATETVNVADEQPPLQTEESSVGNVMEERSIRELPLNGRQPFTLVLLVPGVQTTSRASNGFADASNQSFSMLKINGGSNLGNQFLLDGAMDTLPTINEVSVIPMVDSIAEFRVMTNTLPAEFGQTSGGVINLATKTGTNGLHGSAYEFVRNDALNAVNRFAVVTATSPAKPKLRYNQFGGTIGGPVWIPKLYNGHDKTFFFFGYEQWHQRSASLQLTSVPTALQRTGDFSQTFDASGAVIPIYNPATTMANPHGTGVVRTPINGNVIKMNMMDPLALNLLKYIPLPNTPPQSTLTNVNNYFADAAGAIDEDVIGIRVDHRFSVNDSLFARYASNLNRTVTPGFGLGISDPQARNDTRKNYNLAIGETHTFSPAVVNEFRLSFVRQVLTYIAPSVEGNWPTQLGFPADIPDNEFPAVTINGMLGVGNNSPPSDGVRVGTVIQVADSVTWVRGKHVFKFGFEDHISRFNQQQQNYPSGQFSFTGNQTSNPQASGGTGIAFADFLLGAVNSGQLTYNPGFSVSSWAGGVFVQDDYKVWDNLTFNIGIRYELFGPPTERHNYFSTFDPTVINPQTQMLGEMVYAGVTAPRTFVHYGYPYVAPRAGFAYSINSKTVVRGGAAIIYNPVESADVHQTNNDAIGFSATNTFAASATAPAFQLSVGPNPATLIAPTGAAGGPTAYRGQSVFYQAHDTTVPYNIEWNLTVQRELPGKWTASATYVGNHGVRLIGGNYNYNQMDPKYFASYGPALQNLIPNPYYGQITSGPLASPTISQGQALLPLPDYQSITTLARHGADSIYHALEATAEHRFSRGLTALFAYTKGKLIDDSSSTDSGASIDGAYRLGRYDPQLDRSLDANDVSQNLSVSGVWLLPIGQQSHGLMYSLIGGWQLNGLLAWQTGFPLSVNGTSNFTGLPYPNLTGNPTLPSSQRSVKKWFNTSAFTNPADYQIGTGPRELPATRAPGYTNVNASLTKNFKLWSTGVLQFRVEAFNVFNHPQLNAPNTNFAPEPNTTANPMSTTTTNSAFGTITSALDPRDLQLGLHLGW
jgi:hypothetical protein